MKTLAERLQAMTPVNWSLVNFIQLQAVHLMLILLAVVMFYLARDEWIVPQDQLQLIMRVWLWVTWTVFAYTVIGILLWLWNVGVAVRDWWKARDFRRMMHR